MMKLPSPLLNDLVCWSSGPDIRLIPFTSIQKYPLSCLLRNPNIDSQLYDKCFRKNYRFGTDTTPSTLSDAWPKVVDRIITFLQVPQDITVISVQVLYYSEKDLKPHFHKDPSIYSYLASVTLKGFGKFYVKSCRQIRSTDLSPGSVVVLPTFL